MTHTICNTDLLTAAALTQDYPTVLSEMQALADEYSALTNRPLLARFATAAYGWLLNGNAPKPHERIQDLENACAYALKNLPAEIRASACATMHYDLAPHTNLSRAVRRYWIASTLQMDASPLDKTKVLVDASNASYAAGDSGACTDAVNAWEIVFRECRDFPTQQHVITYVEEQACSGSQLLETGLAYGIVCGFSDCYRMARNLRKARHAPSHP